MGARDSRAVIRLVWPSSLMDSGAATRLTAIASSSRMVTVVADLPKEIVSSALVADDADTFTTLFSATTLLSTAVTVTVPVLVVSPMATVSVVFADSV